MADPRCMTCKFSDPQQNGTHGICAFDPPTVAVIITPQGPAGMSIERQVILTRIGCHNYEEQLVRPVGGAFHLPARPGVK